MCVIFNPASGRRQLADHLDRFRRQFGPRFEPLPTRHPGHAEELAYGAAQAGFSVVAAAGGDGTVHEVANGLLRAARPGVALQIVPVGSANDYAFSLGIDHRFPGKQRLALRHVDVGLARRDDGKERFFINGLGLGFNAAVTCQSRKIRHVRGLPLYTLGLLRALCYDFHAPSMEVIVDGQPRHTATLALTVSIGRREGNFVMAPDAVVDDGLFDYLHAGAVARWELLRFLPAIITGWLPATHPEIWIGQCRQVRVQSQTPLAVHLDGELFCLPRDQVSGIEVQILPRALAVLAPAASERRG
jgi:diacylglycerol kinase family enzyme